MINNIGNSFMPSTNKLQNNIEKLNEDKHLEERLKEEKALKEVCEDFEAIFVHMMLKSGRSTVADGGLIEKSNGTKMFEDMYDQELAGAISKSGDGGLGIGKMLYEQMKVSLNHKRPEVEENVGE